MTFLFEAKEEKNTQQKQKLFFSSTVKLIRMGGNQSKTSSFASQVARDVTDIQMSTIMNNFAKIDNTQDMTLNFGACTVKGVNITQEQTFTLDMTALQEATNDTTIDSKLEQQLKQKAEATKALFSAELLSSDTVQTNANVLSEAYTEIYSKTRHDCLLELTNAQAITASFDSQVPGFCNVEDLVLTQDLISNAVMNCTQKAVTNNDIIKKISSEIGQSATMEEEQLGDVIGAFFSGLTAPLKIAMVIGGILLLVFLFMLNSGGGVSDAVQAGIAKHPGGGGGQRAQPVPFPMPQQ